MQRHLPDDNWTIREQAEIEENVDMIKNTRKIFSGNSNKKPVTGQKNRSLVKSISSQRFPMLPKSGTPNNKSTANKKIILSQVKEIEDGLRRIRDKESFADNPKRIKRNIPQHLLGSSRIKSPTSLASPTSSVGSPRNLVSQQRKLF